VNKNALLHSVAVAILMVAIRVHGQESDTLKSDMLFTNCLKSFTLADSPLYIVTEGDRKLQIQANGNDKDSGTRSNVLSYIKPDWIQSIEILKGKDATDKYDSLGRNGLILIDLKKGSLRKMPFSIKRKFKSQ